MMQAKLMTPGPVPCRTEPLRQADVSHMDDRFRGVMRLIQQDLRRVFGLSGFTAALTGSGSWGAEVAVMNFLRPGRRAVVLSGGLFGDRFAEMARLRGAEVHVVYVREEGEMIPWEYLGEALALKPDVVALVHVDTSTGEMIPLHDVLEFVRSLAPYSLTVVDAVASAGVIPLNLDGLVDYVFSASQKGFEAPAGLAPIGVSYRAFEQAQGGSWYGDLQRVRGFWERGEYHHTPAVHLILAFREALVGLLEEGLEARLQRSQESYALLREFLGEEFDFPAPHRAAPTVAVLYPKRVAPDKVLEVLRREGFVVSPGIGPSKGKAIRLGLFGKQAEEVRDLVEILRRVYS